MCVICNIPTYNEVCNECSIKCKRYDEILELCNTVISDYFDAVVVDRFDAGYYNAMVDVRSKMRE